MLHDALRGIRALVGMAVIAFAATAAAETVVVVPYAQQDPDIPHPVHSGAPITLKAIVRGLTCAQYDVVWDTNLDSQFNDAATRYNRPGTGTALWDIGRIYNVPVVATDQRVNIQVRAQCVGNANISPTATYKLFVYAWQPDNNPNNWTDAQLEVMSAMAVEESLWYMHRQMNFLDGQNDIGRVGANIRGLYSSGVPRPISGMALWAMAINGHLPAYPPNTINFGGLPEPAGWRAANDARWNNDPYAETVLRLTNDMLESAGVSAGMPAADEADTCGFNAAGAELNCPPIAGTNDGRGIYFAREHGHNSYSVAMSLGGVAAVLPSLAGTPAQRGPAGDVLGRPMEFVIQQAQDLLGWMQSDNVGSTMGGFDYGPNQGNDGSTTQWGFVGMESADVAGRPYGVIVNNRHKYRTTQNTVWNQDAAGAACYRAPGTCANYQLTGGGILGARWAGIHNLPNNNNVPFGGAALGYNTYTNAQLIAAYQRSINYTANNWDKTNGQLRAHGGGWLTTLWAQGDHLCSRPNGVYNTGDEDALRCGNTYAMYSHQKGYRTGTPTMQVPGKNWLREFGTYYVRAMVRSNNYSRFGMVYDSNCEAASIDCGHTGTRGGFGTAAGGLILTPTIFNPKPVGVARVNNAVTTTVVEGCSGGNNGQVSFSHRDSFHPNPSARIIQFQWDVDATDGLWWVTGANPDFQTGDLGTSFSYRYQRAGNYTATLRVVDNGVGDAQQSDVRTVTVVVNAANNVAPTAATGGPYVVEVNSNLSLNGTAADGNSACGQVITTAWDLNNTNTWNAAAAPNGTIQWAALAGFPQRQAIPLRMRVRDAAGLEAIDATTVTIYPANPVAVGSANPAQAACNQDITFNGAASYHPNPQRSIAQYHWDVTSDGTYDGGGQSPNFTWRYGQYGTYTVTLRVTDDLGRTHTTTFQVRVDQGNQPPVARTSAANYTVLEGDNLTLDGTQSADANAGCGDSIVTYAWDINGDGDFVDAVDVANASRPVIPWATLNGLRKFADPVTGLPNNTITLRVTDEFGATATVNATITIYQAAPIAVVVQSPDPAPINLVTGFSNPTLNGQESRSPVPNMAIASYDWDLDDNGTFEVLNRPAVEFQRVYLPVPQPNNMPQTFVRLRVTDAAGRQGTVRYQVRYRVPPTPPTADADPTSPPERNYHILLGQGVALDPRQSFDPDTRDFGDYIRTYRWDVNANVNNPAWDRTVNDNGQQQNVVLNLSAQDLAALGVNAAGQYTILLEVEDTTNLTNRDTATLFVYAAAPVAVARANPNPAACGDRITFDASASDHPHPGVQVVGWEWDLDGNGTYETQGVNVNRVFNAYTFNNPIRVGLRVTDSNGATGTTTVDVNVNQGNHSPVAAPGGPYTIVRNDGLTLDGRGSVDPDAACGDAIVDYGWDLRNDGTFEFTGANAAQQAVTWQQLNAAGINGVGNYTVALRVRDRFGVTSVTPVAFNVINGPVAVAVAVPNSVACNGEVDFDASGSRTDAPANDARLALAAWEWDFDGNGTYETSGRTVRRAVSGQGNTVTVGFRVTDASGHTATTQVVVTLNVQNIAPVSNAGGPYATGRVGNGFAGVTLDGRGSSDPNAPCDSIARYKWDTDLDGQFGNDDAAVNGSPNGRDYEGATVAGYVNPAWVVGGQYIVRLIVCDNKNPQLCSQPSETVINVRQEAPPTGQILSPRSNDPNFCAGANPFNVTFEVADPEGDRVNVTARVGGVNVAGPLGVNTNANGTPVQSSIQINPANVPEGPRILELVFDDGQGGTQTVNAGGTILFDRTAPVVTFGANPVLNACYPPNQVPAPQFNVVDAGDANPQVAQATANNGCGRTLTVTGTDRCGNVGSASRTYLVAEQVDVTINGANEGQLVAQAQLTWQVVGPAGCASNITSTYTRNGGAAQNYVQNTVLNQPGAYTLTLRVTNCAGVARDILRSFVINAPPTPDAITNGHAANNPAGPPNTPAYIIAEGAGLQVDASESRPPEAIDSITGYRWDFTNNGTWDSPAGGGYAAVPTAAYPTNDNGVFTGKLEVKDSLNAVASQLFQVTVTDVTPTARPGGPYAVNQGVELLLDGSASTAGHPVADPIATFSWNFGDGTPVETGPPATHAQRRHTFAENGVYNVTLTVRDEDSQHQATAVVTVRDVDPVIGVVTVPNPAYEIAVMRFRVQASGGAPNDPIQRVEWDFNGDGQPERAGAWPALADTTWEFENEGNYTVSVKLFDKDSNVTHGQQLRVRMITMDELMTVAQERINAIRAANPAAPALALARVQNTDAFINAGHWGERYTRRGNTWAAYEQVTFDIARSQAAGGQFGNLLWAMSRTFLREVNALHDTAEDQLDPPADSQETLSLASVRKAEEYITRMTAMYNDPAYRGDVSGQNNTLRARDFTVEARDAYFFLADALDPFNRRNNYAMPPIGDPETRVREANAVNTELVNALTWLRDDMTAYVAAGGANDPGPGRAAVQTALNVLTQQVMPLMQRPIGIVCNAGECISDRDALMNELYLMDLINSLYTAQSQNTWVRNWQHGLMLAVKFRVELSLLRVEYVCGRFSPIAIQSRQQQATGLGMVNAYQYEQALRFYISDNIRCLMIRAYNTCLVPAARDPQNTPPVQNPAFCPP